MIQARKLKLSPEVRVAFATAIASRRNSHSPYSRFAVGAALKLGGVRRPLGGCNIENASFGATVCAERVALYAAVAAYGSIRPDFLVVVTAEEKATVPCALCLQALAEFCGDDFRIYLGNEQGLLRAVKLRELLPEPFRHFSAEKRGRR